MSLEAGERELPAIELRDEQGHTIRARTSLLQVGSSLTDGEDIGRAPADLHTVVDHRAGHISLWWLMLPPLGGLLLLLTLIRRTRRARAALAQAPDVQQTLSALCARDFDQMDEVREIFYGLAQLLRAELDGLHGRERSGETDEEWLAHARQDRSLQPEQREQLVTLFAACEEVKYAGSVPTRFRVEECLNNAKALIDALPKASTEDAA